MIFPASGSQKAGLLAKGKSAARVATTCFNSHFMISCEIPATPYRCWQKLRRIVRPVTMLVLLPFNLRCNRERLRQLKTPMLRAGPATMACHHPRGIWKCKYFWTFY